MSFKKKTQLTNFENIEAYASPMMGFEFKMMVNSKWNLRSGIVLWELETQVKWW